MKRLQRGAALLLVLWVIGLLSVLLGGLAMSVQLQQRQAIWRSNQTDAVLTAQAGLELAVVNLLRAGPSRWLADGREHAVQFNHSTLQVSVTSERGKLDLNAGSAHHLEKLLRAGGASSEDAKRITQALRTRRNKVPLRMLEEYRQLPGMTDAVYLRTLPWITVWSGNAEPDPGLAPPPLAQVLGLPSRSGLGADAGKLVTITSIARRANGFSAELQATVVLLPGYAGGKPYRVLRWRE